VSNHSRRWIPIAIIGLIVLGVAFIAVPLLAPAASPSAPTPIPTALTINQSGVPFPAVPRVGVGDARAAQHSGQAVFVDVRSAGQYAQSHVSGAQSIPLNELESRLNELNKDQWIIAYCS
jgi:hypothetical protein